MQKLCQKNAGVTLIEMVVVIAILGITASVTMISFGTSRNKNLVEINARELATVIRTAQNYTLSGRQSGTGTTCGYEVRSISATQYQMNFYHVEPGGTCVSDGILDTYTLKQNVEFTESSVGIFVSFRMPYGDVSANATFDLSKDGSHHYVCVTDNGEIRDSTAPTCS